MSDLQLIFIGSSAFIVLITFSILFVVYYKQKQAEQKIAMQELKAEMQRQLLESSLEVQEVERRRIAKDLHDEVGAMLSVTKMSFNQLLKKINTSPDLTDQGKKTKEFLEESISQVRRISRELVPSTLEDFGLISAIDEFIQKIHIASGVLFIFNHEGIEEGQRFDKKIELTIYRIAQELVNNALKHAEAQEISLKLLLKPNKLSFVFTDNGKGFDLEAVKQDPKAGLGLRNIESRLSVVDGTFKIKSAKGEGTNTRIDIPLLKNYA
ncbi:sensor histidine kinase [Emticicia soli]|uniref:histidine kinase n=1 Tax=Emticicia soli TaxID=2027878 RepID=A0ABW5J3A7_9BACT